MEREGRPLPIEQEQINNVVVQPYIHAARQEFNEKYPQQAETMDTIVEEFMRQSDENFTTFHSQLYPNVSFTTTTINVTDIARKLAEKKSGIPLPRDEEQDTEPLKPRLYVANFPGSAPPSDSHAYSASDVVFHRVISELPKVARAIKKGEPVPEIEILMPGGPDALGGTITRDFFNRFDKNGFTVFGKLYAEYLKKTLPQDIAENENAHLEIDGYSQGAVIASELVANLDPSLQEKTQTLLDNPAGNHEPGILNSTVKGVQVPVGLEADILFWKGRDNVSKEFNKHSGAFRNYLVERHGLNPDEQKWLKRAMFVSKGLHLMKGTPIDTNSHRHFIRESLKDPLATGFKRFWRAKKATEAAQENGYERSLMAAKDQGRSFTALTGQTEGHIWTFQFYDKWNKKLDYVTHNLASSSPLPEAE